MIWHDPHHHVISAMRDLWGPQGGAGGRKAKGTKNYRAVVLCHVERFLPYSLTLRLYVPRGGPKGTR